MKIFIVILASITLTSCENSSNASSIPLIEKPKQEIKQQSVIVDSIQSSNKVLGNYASFQHFNIEFGSGHFQASKESMVTFKIEKNKDNNLYSSYSFHSNSSGAGYLITTAEAQVLNIEKKDANVYKLKLVKKLCSVNGYMEPKGEIKYNEQTPEINPEFFITINLKDEKKIIIESTALESECNNSWKFSNLSFIKEK